MNWVKVVLTLIPFIWGIGMIPFVNRVEPMILGLPFLGFWLASTTVVSFICLSIIYYKIDKPKGNNNQSAN
ncbi:DUF3311 domain-containing protein [Caldanaerobacter subterraneus KAk]|uniref:DUF3311 domain-containing protein n=1 Tax=Caldanaerobacter subterraneus TaxID=911092 RepID=UPI0032BF3180